MRALLLFAVLATATPALAQESGGQDAASTIVVTGTPLSETGKRLEQCLARHCPPMEDMEASLAHAENQLLAGDYLGARDTLRAAHNRNMRYAKEYPVEVADLNRAFGRVVSMNGKPESGRLHQIESLEALQKAFGDTDARVLIQRIATGDAYAQTGRLRAATDVYRKVQKQARAAGQLRIVGFAILREAVLYTALSLRDSGFRNAARYTLRKVLKSKEPELEEYRVAAHVLQARIAKEAGDEDAMEREIASLVGKGFKTPVLVYDEPAYFDPPETGTVERNVQSDPEWVDIRYRIDAGGHVRDIEQIRQSPIMSGDWAAPIRKVIGRRRYVPLDLPAGSDGITRIERYTLVFDIIPRRGARAPTRSTRGRLTTLDITPDAPPASNGG